MNILHINKFHYFRGGAEVVYLNTARLLESKGHRSVFFSMHHPQNIPCETSCYFLPYVELHTNNNGMMSKLKTGGRILYFFEAKKLLSQLLDKYPVDIAHLHNIYHHISPSILHVLKKRKIPVVMTLHDYKMVCASYHLQAFEKPCEACYGGKYFMAIKKRCVKESLAKTLLSTSEMYLHHKALDIYDNVDIFISPSRFLKDKLSEMGFKKEIVCLPNYIDSEKFRGLSGDVKRQRDKKENSLVYFGRLSPEKGLLTLIEAAKILYQGNKHNNCVTVKIIGDGPMREELREKVKSDGIDNVRFLGYMKGEDLYREIKNSMAAILPSEWYENNPMSVIEAFAMGIPVIGARIGGIPELIRDNETGLTFQPGNAEDLSEKIETLLADSSPLAEMGEKAQKFVEDELNQEKHYRRLMEIYGQIAL